MESRFQKAYVQWESHHTLCRSTRVLLRGILRISTRFPLKDKEITNRWAINMKRENWFPTTASYLCSAHFEEKYMYQTNVQRRLLSKPVPTIFIFPPHLQKRDKVLRPQPRKRSFDNLQDSAITVTS
ncbi:THAP domain-containing protein 5-like [Schistocerca serialis cubense]|uniref:THAP domain-containing protein 5-like n=1 Tax=Schistocerca serialis cubense TaxID=2023355 RepID=UPI00214F3C29|nr:THAP domain-containing protein 5-like [Schistocerca serialis cubense]